MSSFSSGTTPFLKNDEYIALREKRLELHCMQMRLEQISDHGMVFSGPGSIRQGADGQLEFTLYARETISLDSIMHDMSGASEAPAGQIMPDRLLYRLSATDADGREWTSSHTLPSKHSFEGGTLCTGRLHEIVFITNPPVSVKHDQLRLEIYDDIEIPVNTQTVVSKTIGGQEATSSLLNVLKFETALYEFILQKDKGILQIKVITKDQLLVDNFEMRFAESLQFAVARPIFWSVMEKWTTKQWEIRIRAIRSDEARSRIGSPIVVGPDSALWFCAIFERYMAFVLTRQTDEKIHPISAQVRAICHASIGAIEAQALALSVAIESILKYVHPSKYELTSEEREWIEKAQSYFSTWGGPGPLSERAIGLLTMLYSPGASIRLAELVEIGAITNRQRQAWGRLRHKLAHGETLGSASLQEFLDLTNEVLVMFYHLVFHAIGYKGKYTNYGYPGWPTQDYRVSEPSQDNTN